MTRPLLERVRESLFNILAPRLPRSQILDLCSGTGVAGLEAISRGAQTVVFVEGRRANVQLIHSNINALDVETKTKVLHGILPGFLRRLRGEFDLILFDPPFAGDLAQRVLEDPAFFSHLREGGTLVLRRRRGDPALDAPRFSLTRRHQIGDSELWFYGK